MKNVTYLNSDMKFETRDMLIKDGRISFNFDSVHEQPVMECVDYFVLPGLVNAHFHSYSPLTKGLMKEMELKDWCNDSVQGKIQQLFFNYIDHVVSGEDFVYVAQKSYIDMVKNGVTFVSDSDPGEQPQLLSDAMEAIGLRGIVDTYEEVNKYYKTSGEHILFGSHLLEEEDMTREELMRVKRIKETYKPIMMTHCLENEWRSEIVHSEFGKSSIALYDEMNLLDADTVLFHGVFMSKEDIALIAKRKSSVVHCPISNLETGAGIANVGYMLEKGVNVCLGTDYGHTNIWELMRIAYYLLKVHHPVQKFSSEDIFKMATIQGAKAYQLDHDIGQIKEGYKADLIFIKKDFNLAPLLNEDTFSTYLHNLLFHMKDDSVRHVMIGGKWVMRDRKLLTVDEEKIESRYHQIAAGFLAYLDKMGKEHV